jgi:ElaB/YqjD/DUF883 family membrane-anchored ribosome-binding protein
VTTSPSEPNASDPDALRRDIDQTREHLADTVDALHHKLDVKAQAKGKAKDWQNKAQHSAQVWQQNAQANLHNWQLQAQDLWQRQPQAVVGAAAAAVGLVFTVVLVRRR